MIRPAGIPDFKFIYSLYMHRDINPFLLYEPMDEETFRPIFVNLVEQGVIYLFIVENAVPVGMFKLVRLNHRTDHIAYLGGVAIDPAQSNKGFAKLMMREIIDMAKGSGLRRIELSVAVHNTKAIHLYEQSGFEKEGILRKYSHLKQKDEYWDEFLMSRLLW